eukprot:8760067-Pyramimonas_sp.AAC.1
MHLIVFSCSYPECRECRWTTLKLPSIFDVNLANDNGGKRYTFLNIVCQGATLQRAISVKQGGGTPSSRARLTAPQQNSRASAGKPNRPWTAQQRSVSAMG